MCAYEDFFGPVASNHTDHNVRFGQVPAIQRAPVGRAARFPAQQLLQAVFVEFRIDARVLLAYIYSQIFILTLVNYVLYIRHTEFADNNFTHSTRVYKFRCFV